MDPPRYDGTVHPEEWIQQVEAFCLCKNINISTAKLCKHLIHPTIKIPSIVNITTNDELLNALETHASFNIFKKSCKRKLLALKYIPEKDGEDTAAFLSKFQSLCYNAEINDIEEIKMIIYKIMVSNEFFRSEFSKKLKKINLMEELLTLISDIIEDEAILIKSGSCIALKHSATGKYLSSVSNLNYKTGSGNQAVFAGETFPEPNALWIIAFNTNFAFDDSQIYLTHEMTGSQLTCYHNQYESPLSKHSEVNCYVGYGFGGHSAAWKLKMRNSTNNCTHVKSQDRIILQNNDYDKVLRSHELEFEINDKLFQEVVCHDERIGGNDEWIIELIS
ncbi:hypothetical protein RclHR1_01850014 [Rhizophagus clarus]|uniref:MIR domain-containing protein n=1 Tax=Rhizophagus clarus TaxID=94130 RepID=A0A2Z6R175_9GLOM|nr:hypothetical protein RclHR1_01850014 [Rhizophagus clarus]GES92677.1 hypothetical protein GLOIN_2v1598936 [Rhizophagus clarus]